jgi:hypothetical protein
VLAAQQVLTQTQYSHLQQVTTQTQVKYR